jgi:hypothetical protein
MPEHERETRRSLDVGNATEPRDVEQEVGPSTRYTIGTIVTDWNAYEAMRASFMRAGFAQDCEYLYVDNSQGNRLDAFAAYNRLIATARGERILLVHQDVLADFDNRHVLDQRIREIETIDPNWGVLGNAGIYDGEKLAVRITDPHGTDQYQGELPQEVESVDENFVLIRRDAALGVSHDLYGFHLYALDLCLQASFRGLKSYVIDFHVRHLSPGKLDDDFWQVRQKMIRKYRRVFRPKAVSTPSTWLPLGGPILLSIMACTRTLNKVARRLYRFLYG